MSRRTHPNCVCASFPLSDLEHFVMNGKAIGTRTFITEKEIAIQTKEFHRHRGGNECFTPSTADRVAKL